VGGAGGLGRVPVGGVGRRAVPHARPVCPSLPGRGRGGSRPRGPLPGLGADSQGGRRRGRERPGGRAAPRTRRVLLRAPRRHRCRRPPPGPSPWRQLPLPRPPAAVPAGGPPPPPPGHPPPPPPPDPPQPE